MEEIIMQPSASSHPDYLKYTVFTLLMPIIGLILGVTLIIRKNKKDKSLGEHLLAFSILLSFLYSVFYVFYTLSAFSR